MSENLSEDLEKAQRIDRASLKASALAEIAVRAAALGQKSQAVGILVQALETAETIDNGFEKHFIWPEIAEKIPKIVPVEAVPFLAQTLPDGMGKNLVLYKMAVKIADSGKIAEAVQLAQTIPDGHEKALALSSIAIDIAKAGKIVEAVQFAQTIEPESEKAIALRSLAANMADLGKVTEAIELAQTIEPESEKAIALSAIAANMAELGKVTEAIELAKTIESDFDKTQALREIIVNLTKAGNFIKAVEIAKDIESDFHQARALLEIAVNLAKSGRVIDAVDIAKTIESDSDKAEALREIAVCVAKTGDFRDAVGIAKTIKYNGIRTRAFNEIATLMAEAQEFSEALEILQTVPPGRKSGALGSIAFNLAKAKQLSKSLQVVETIVSPGHKYLTLRSIAVYLVEAGQLEVALEVVSSIEDVPYKIDGLKQMSDRAASLGKHNLFIQLAKNSNDAFIKAWQLATLAKDTGESENYKGALELIQTIEDKSFQALALVYIAREAELEMAVETFVLAFRIVQTIEDKQSQASILTEMYDRVSDFVHLACDAVVRGKLEESQLSPVFEIAAAIESACDRELAEQKAAAPAPAADAKTIDEKAIDEKAKIEPYARNQFSFKLFSEILRQDRERNIFISPPSIALGLALTSNGASGETEKAIAKTLGIEGITQAEFNQANADLIADLANDDASVGLRMANSLWAAADIFFKPDFVRRCQDFYQAEVGTLDFTDPTAPSIINDWVKQQTDGKIDWVVDTIESSSDALSALFLINAIYFKGKWADRFQQKATQERLFTSLDGTQKQHPMMAQFGRYRYYQNEKFQAISLPYEGYRVSMYIFLPHREIGLQSFWEILTAQNWEQWMTQFSPQKGFIVLPRFRIEYRIELSNPLEALGMGLAFDRERADFSAMRPIPPNLWLDRVIHKTFVATNEEGTEAGAVTVASMKGAGRPQPTIPFIMICDRPFFYAIRDNTTKTILFMGSVAEPH